MNSTGEFGRALCAAIGLADKHVKSITIRAVADKPVEVEVVLLSLVDDGERLIELLKRYGLTPKEEAG